MTHTYALLEVSQAAYDEIAAKLRDAGYDHAFHESRVDGVVIDMHGIALQPPAPKGLLSSDAECLTDLQSKAVCLDCGLPYTAFPLDLNLPRGQWLLIHPGEHGLLCAQCIVTRAAQIPGATVVHAVIEISPTPLAEDRP